MTETYLTLPKKDQAQILRTIATNKNIMRDAILLEKDIWICWALEFLFKMPNQLPMAFKGGTSLSKAFHVIDRFSEDVDITIDYNAFNCDNPFAEGVSKTKIQKISDQLKSMVTQHLKDYIIPYFQQIISEQFKENSPRINLDDDGETVHLYYPTVIEQKSGYISDSVRLEFGGRNLTTPSDTQTIRTDISKYVSDLSFPSAKAIVLSPQKTYWEKITLMHSECNRHTFKENADRISRHWYDVSMLTNHHIGKQALVNRELLNEVIRVKKIFYNSSFSKYDDCLNGKMRLLPKDKDLELLKGDFNKMLNNKMFYGEQPDFNLIISEIEKLESILNGK